MKLRIVLAALAVVGGWAGGAQAVVAPPWDAPRGAPMIAPAGWHPSVAGLDCARCIDVKLAPAPIGYRRAGRWRHHRARYGRALRVRG